MMHRCLEHGEDTAWGCRACLRRSIRAIVARHSAETAMKIACLFDREGAAHASAAPSPVHAARSQPFPGSRR